MPEKDKCSLSASARRRPKVTVLMSVYNAEKYLSQAMESILGQTFSDFEFLIVDDGSTDGSEQIIKRYSDQRISLISRRKRVGLARCLNLGLKEAKGDLIARMDGDDVSLPDRLQRQAEFMQLNPGVGVVSSWVERIDADGGFIGCWDREFSSEEIYYILNFQNCLPHPSVMVRREVFLASGGYDETLPVAQDYELWRRLAKMSRMAQVKEVLLKWRQTEQNISGRRREEQKHILLGLVKKRIEDSVGNPISNEDVVALQYHEVVDGIQLKRVMSLLAQLNQSILFRERLLMIRLGLDLKKMEKVMELKKRNILYQYYRHLSPAQTIRQFWDLDFGLKSLFLKEVMAGVKRKIKRFAGLKKPHE